MPPATALTQHNRYFKKPQAGGRVYCLEAEEKEETEDPHTVVSGTLIANHFFTWVLFDAAATHSFINPTTAKRLACEPDEMDVHYVKLPQ